MRQACEHDRDNGLDKEVKDKRKDRDEVYRRDSKDWLLQSSLMLPDNLFDICQLTLLNRACALYPSFTFSVYFKHSARFA